jgi:small Trp-rich protein
MPLVLIGALLLLCKLLELGPVSDWSWWIVLAPFGAAALWWQFSDATGLTQRKAMDKMALRKADRRAKAMAKLGLDRRRERQVSHAQQEAAARRQSADPTQADATAAQDAPPRRDPTR